MKNSIKARILFTELSIMKGLNLKEMLKISKENKGWVFRALEKIVSNNIEDAEKQMKEQKARSSRLNKLSEKKKTCLSNYLKKFELFKKNCKLIGKKRRLEFAHFKQKNKEMHKLNVFVTK